MNNKFKWGILIIVVCLGLFYLFRRPDYTPLTEDTDHIIGLDNASVTIVEFSDFQCPACQSAFFEMEEFLDTNPKNLRFIYKHYPLTNIHPYGFKAAEASECASDQGKFWEYYKQLFQNRQFDNAALKKYAANTDLNEDSFWTCIRSRVMAERVNQDMDDGDSKGVDATPTFYINGKKKVGVIRVDELKELTKR